MVMLQMIEKKKKTNKSKWKYQKMDMWKKRHCIWRELNYLKNCKDIHHKTTKKTKKKR